MIHRSIHIAIRNTDRALVAVVQRIPLRSIPLHIGVQGEVIRVETDTGPLGFELTNSSPW